MLQEKKIGGSCAGIGHDWEVAIALLQYKRVDPHPLISMIVPLDELEMALNELHTEQGPGQGAGLPRDHGKNHPNLMDPIG